MAMLDEQNRNERVVPLIDAAIAYLSSHNEEDIISILSGYPDVEKKADALNRTLLHVAASQGKNKVVKWLHERGASLYVRDHENHWTALHRAAFYGYLSTACLLMELGREEFSNGESRVHGLTVDRLLSIRDKENLTYLDLLISNVSQRPLKAKFKEFIIESKVAYTWGLNVNGFLGHIKMQVKAPDQVDCFRRLGVSISMVSIGTYHTIFLGQSGEVYTCGHGSGGRLGHGDEHSLLIPRQVHMLKEKCKSVSASFNQSFFVARSDSVYACGVNVHNLMCQNRKVEKLLIPHQMDLKNLSGFAIENVFGLKHHVIVQTPASIYTFGLNAGQLGHPKVEGERYIAQPRCVTRVGNIRKVAVSDAATVAVTRDGHVFVMQDYNCKKIAVGDAISDICISGGKLDESATSDLKGLDRVKPRELVVAILSANHHGKVIVWTDGTKTTKRLLFSPTNLRAKSIALSRNSNVLALTSVEGQLWQGQIPYDIKTSVAGEAMSKANRSAITLGKAFACPEFLEVQMERIPNVHGAESVVVDDKGIDFALIAVEQQVGSPEEDKKVRAKNKRNKMESQDRKIWFQRYPASEDDRQILNLMNGLPSSTENSPDVVIKSSEGDLFTCHRDILMSKTPYFETMFRQYEQDVDTAMGWCENTGGMTLTTMDVRTPSLNILLTHVYSGTLDSCDKKDLENCDTMFECLLAADQYFLDGLKSDLEQHVYKMINLRTIASFIRISGAIQSEVLLNFCLDFVCSNAPCLVESGALDNIEPDIMSRIDSAYRNFVDKKSYRTITPYASLPFPGRARTDSIRSAKKKRRAKAPPTRDSIQEAENESSDSRPSPPSPSPVTEMAAAEMGSVVASASSDSFELPIMVSESASDTQKSDKGHVKKISQKARKEEERKKRQLEKDIQKPVEVKWKTPKEVKICNPWKSVNNDAISPATSPTSPGPSPAVPSFKALMELEMKSQPPLSDGPKPRSPFVAKSTPKSKTFGKCGNASNNEKIKTSFGLVVTDFKNCQPKTEQPPPTPSSPWGKVPVAPVNPELGQPAVTDPEVLSSIIRDEENQVEMRNRLAGKSLHLVQLEERAIEELKAYYGADEGREHVVITRAPFTASKPLWAATQRQHKSHS